MTIKLYESRLRHYADFLEVPVEDLHNHLTKENLIDYAEHIQKKASTTKQTTFSILLRFYKVNGIQAFDELETAILKPRNYDEPDDKPLTLEILQKMMELANPRERAIITMLISTGMRAGELCAIRLDDIDEDLVRIRPEVTHQRGRTVWLNAEAREALDLWLTLRDDYQAAIHNKYYTRTTGLADTRLFCSTYNSMKRIWLKLYDRVDGERGKYRAKCTMHSCRKYFRTNAVHTMDLDLVEMLMGHEGYLTKAYLRIPMDEAREKYHEGEHALYITRVDNRVMSRELEELRQATSGKITALENEVRRQKEVTQLLEKRLMQGD